MNGLEPLVVAFLGGVVTSASPCAIGAVPVAIAFVGGQQAGAARAWVLSAAFVGGMTIAISLLGLAAARAGLSVASASGLWSWIVGMTLVAAGLWIGLSSSTRSLSPWTTLIQRWLPLSGAFGALLLGALSGTVMSPCASPALIVALSLAAQRIGPDETAISGALPLVAYAIGHSALLFVAGALPGIAQSAIRRIDSLNGMLPGRRTFATLMALSGIWWMLQPYLS